MPSNDMKGITVKVAADLHSEVRQYIESHNMTMGEFVAIALDNELHPKLQMNEGINVGNTRTIAFQVPEELFQRIKDYLQRNNMTQKQFLVGLIEDELERDQEEREKVTDDKAVSESEDSDEEDEEVEETAAAESVIDEAAISEYTNEEPTEEPVVEDDQNEEDEGFSMVM